MSGRVERYLVQITKKYFMFFDRYEIHIQDFQEIIGRNLIMFGARLFEKCQKMDFRKVEI